jgi:hypothetical protein
MLEGDLQLGLALCHSTAELERHGPVIKHSLRCLCMPCVGACACACACACRVCMRARARATGGCGFRDSFLLVSGVFSSQCLCPRHLGIEGRQHSCARVGVCTCSGRQCGRDTCRHRWSLSPFSLRVATPRPPYWSSPCCRSSQRSRRPNPARALGRKRRKPLAVGANLCLLLRLLLTLASPSLRLVPDS